jgi:hypothetical protein
MRVDQNCYAVLEFLSWFHLCGSGLENATVLLASESGMVRPLTLLLG